jgi:predicted nucleic acid-binding protein
VIYLLDVNALISLAFNEHLFHRQVVSWMKSLEAEDKLASCSISELGFVRILPQMPEVDFTVDEARHLLLKIKEKSNLPFLFLSDNLGVDQLPRWVKQPKQITDGHLAALAKAHGALLATLDNKSPGAFLIPV